MIEAVFISDLHLHPDDKEIKNRFDAFIEWALTSVKKVYILGDFFHVWAGDDSLNEWSQGIAKQLHSLTSAGIPLYYMHGNRDFLLGATFAKHAGWKVLSDPATVKLGMDKVLLSHGDGYCTKDKSHQRFRFLTRNKVFTWFFSNLPLSYRLKLVNKVRKLSQSNHTKSMEQMDVVSDSVIKGMLRNECEILIHGHTHKSGLTTYEHQSQKLKRYVLSDWDDNPQLLCYDHTIGLYFMQA